MRVWARLRQDAVWMMRNISGIGRALRSCVMPTFAEPSAMEYSDTVCPNGNAYHTGNP